MAKQLKDVDWYVDMSERLERREQRRKWVVLGFFVAVSLLVMGGLVLYIVLDKAGWFSSLQGAPEKGSPEKVVIPNKSLPVDPTQAASFHRGDVRFPQLDNEGLVTSMTHFFREERPEKAQGFTVNRVSEDEGSIASYRLRNVGTAEVFEIPGVKVKRLNAEWTITDEGWDQIREELQGKMKVRLGRPAV